MLDQNEVKCMKRKIEKALRDNRWNEARRICNDLGAYFSKYGKYEDALNAYQEALSASEMIGGTLEIALAKRMIAETLSSLGKYEEAIECADSYLRLSEEAKSKIEEQRGYATKGRIYFCWAEFLENGKWKVKQEKIINLLNDSIVAYEKSLAICEHDLKDVDLREKLEMKSRLLQNLGLTMGLKKHFSEAVGYLTCAIEINKAENFKESLYWCYLSKGEFFILMDDIVNACAQFDLAYNASTTSENKHEALRWKARAYFCMGNHTEAKKTLRKLYTLQSGKDKEVVRQLRIAVFLCKIEKKLSSTPSENFRTKKELYENQGDAYCAIKVYAQGVKSYLKMLECAEKAGLSGNELLPCYTSLSQTYKDNKQYDLALIYCEKELELLEDVPSESCRSYLFLGQLYESLEYDYDTIYSTYEKSLEIAEQIDDKELQIMILKYIIHLQKELGHITLAENNENLIKTLKSQLENGHDFDSEPEFDTQPFTFDVGDDELFSDAEEEKPKYRSKRSVFKIKRNEKGETELHVATIKGNYKKVKTLIEQGHPVNEMDTAGWTVLHEACNHGYAEIVELLLSHGADINHPGGKECSGYTPLHDAAENGHFEVIEILLKRGAATAVVTSDGYTPLDCLKRWRTRCTLNTEEIPVYNKLCNSLKSNLDSEDFKMKRKHIEMKTKHIVPERKNSDDEKTPRSKPAKEKNKNNNVPAFFERQMRITDSPCFEFAANTNGCKPTAETSKEPSAAQVYRTAIEGVARRHDAKRSEHRENKTAKEKKPPLIDGGDEPFLDWLEDDLGIMQQPSKKRKVTVLPAEEYDSRDFSECERLSPDNDGIDLMMGSISLGEEMIDVAEDEGRSSPIFNVGRPKAPNQKVTLDPPQEIQTEEEEEAEEEVEEAVEEATGGEKHAEPKQSPITSNRLSDVETRSDVVEITVKILNQRYLIPIARSKIGGLTVGWLAEEAAKRYGELNDLKPTLLVARSDGAILSESDPLSAVANEVVETQVLTWKVKSLSERYREECSRMEEYRQGSHLCTYAAIPTKPDVHVMAAFELLKLNSSLALHDLSLTPCEIIPVLRVLESRKIDLKTLDLSRNVLGDEGVVHLANCLRICSIERLFLVCNNITRKGAQYLCESLDEIPRVNLDRIRVLELSFNPLKDESIPFLNGIIDKLPNLTFLGTDHSSLTKSLRKTFRE